MHKIQGSLFTFDRQSDAREQKHDQTIQAISLRVSEVEQNLKKLDQHTDSEIQGLAQQVKAKVEDMLSS